MHFEYTDPALEYHDICKKLAQTAAKERGDQFIARKLNVTPWSTEFYKILSCITEKGEVLKDLVRKTDMGEGSQKKAIGHIDKTLAAFSSTALQSTWQADSPGLKALNAENLTAIYFTSESIRRVVRYKKLSQEEIESAIANITDLKHWLEEHEIYEADFIRQALITGLEQLEYRLTQIEWLGWPYAMDSLREVVAAYMALERGIHTPNDNPDSEAALKKIGGFLQKTWDVLGTAKEGADRLDIAVKIYASVHLLFDFRQITALIPAG